MKIYLVLCISIAFSPATLSESTVSASIISQDGTIKNIQVTEEVSDKSDFDDLQSDDAQVLKKYDHLKKYEESDDTGFDKKSIIKYAALAGLIYHLWCHKLETITALLGGISHFFAGTNFSAAQRAQMHILSRAVAYGGGLLSLYGFMGLFETSEDYDAALAVKRIIAQAKVKE